MSTQYQHKRIHKGTWIAPDGAIVNQIDHVLINAKKRSVVEDVRSMRGLNCDSDHFLVKTVIKQKLITTPRTGTRDKKRWNSDNRINQDKLGQYRSSLHSSLRNVKAEEDAQRKNGKILKKLSAKLLQKPLESSKNI
jgi:hypothetical protein